MKITGTFRKGECLLFWTQRSIPPLQVCKALSGG